jgi:hypothetical protein
MSDANCLVKIVAVGIVLGGAVLTARHRLNVSIKHAIETAWEVDS